MIDFYSFRKLMNAMGCKDEEESLHSMKSQACKQIIVMRRGAYYHRCVQITSHQEQSNRLGVANCFIEALIMEKSLER